MLFGGGILGFGGGSTEANVVKSVTQTDYSENSYQTTFSDTVSIGAAPTGNDRRFVLVCAMAQFDPTGYDPNAIGIAGSSQTLRANYGSTNNYGTGSACAYTEVSTGTTTPIYSTWDATANRQAMITYSIVTGAGGLSVLDTTVAFNTFSAVQYLAAAANGATIGFGIAFGTSACSYAWSGTIGVVEDVDQQHSGDTRIGFGSASCIPTTDRGLGSGTANATVTAGTLRTACYGAISFQPA